MGDDELNTQQNKVNKKEASRSAAGETRHGESASVPSFDTHHQYILPTSNPRTQLQTGLVRPANMLDTNHLIIAARAAGASVRGGLSNATFGVSPAVSICRTYSFPVILHALLEQAEEQSYDTIISWQYHGRAFLVHDPEDFVKNVMPNFFLQTKFASFVRQLSSYNFPRVRAKSHPDYGSYYHENFLRGIPELCQTMTRAAKEKIPIKELETNAPNFASMPVVGLKNRMHRISTHNASDSGGSAYERVRENNPSTAYLQAAPSFLLSVRQASLDPNDTKTTHASVVEESLPHSLTSSHHNMGIQDQNYYVDEQKPAAEMSVGVLSSRSEQIQRESAPEMYQSYVPTQNFDMSHLSLLQQLSSHGGIPAAVAASRLIQGESGAFVSVEQSRQIENYLLNQTNKPGCDAEVRNNDAINPERINVDTNLLIHDRGFEESRPNMNIQKTVTDNEKGERMLAEQNISLTASRRMSGPHIRELANSIFDSATRQPVQAIQLQNEFFSDFNETDDTAGQSYDHGFTVFESMGGPSGENDDLNTSELQSSTQDLRLESHNYSAGPIHALGSVQPLYGYNTHHANLETQEISHQGQLLPLSIYPPERHFQSTETKSESKLEQDEKSKDAMNSFYASFASDETNAPHDKNKQR